jgi:hypothetical protein
MSSHGHEHGHEHHEHGHEHHEHDGDCCGHDEPFDYGMFFVFD